MALNMGLNMGLNPDGVLHHPATIHLGPLEITGFGLAVLAAFMIAQFVSQQEFERRGQQVEADAMPDITMAALIGTLLGAKTYYVILTGDIHAFLSRGGFVFWGGFIGAVALCWATIKRKGLSFARFADVTGIGIAAGYAVGRSGCWAVGDDYGRPWSGPFAVRFPEGAPPSTAGIMESQFGVHFPPSTTPDTLIAVHPTQLYEVAMGMVMFLVLWRLRAHRHQAGWLFGVYCLLAGVERFVVEFFRAKDDRFFAGLTAAQVIAVGIFTVGVVLMAARRGRVTGAAATA
jgi:phosphatidylglycerol:prolipoprotein diacylglycerol transferase